MLRSTFPTSYDPSTAFEPYYYLSSLENSSNTLLKVIYMPMRMFDEVLLTTKSF